MADQVGDWMGVLDACYPPSDAEAWDNVGLQVGDPADEVDAVLVCLDITEATIAEAQDAGAGLLLAHHPLMFRPLERVTPATAAGRLALTAARAGIAVAAAHTNFDVADDGTTAPIFRLLGIDDARPLQPSAGGADVVKIVVFVPVDDTAAVLSAAFGAGGGAIGEYDECSFRVSGTGTFRPSADANPAVGERERRNDVAEDRVEIVVGRRRMGAVVDAIKDAHPYEEVALDVYPLVRIADESKGLGRVGDLSSPLTVAEVASRLREGLPSPHLRVAGDPARQVTTVAACGGAGDSLISAALAAGAQLYVTGDLRHHVTLDALTMGLSVIDAGHYATEAAALPALIERLSSAATERGLEARLLASSTSTEPWSSIEEEQHR